MPYITIGRKQYDTWPPEDAVTQTRLENYYRSRLLFKGRHHDVFPRVQKWLDREADKAMVYIVCNFAGLLSKVSADMLFGEEPRFIAGEGDEKSKEQISLNNIIDNNNLHTLNYEMALSASWRGETVYRIRYGKFADWQDTEFPIIEATSPGYFYPILEEDNIRGLRGGVFGWIKQGPGDKEYLRLERQLPGLIENELWLMEGSKIQSRVKLSTFPEYAEMEDVQETKYPGLLFEFVPNWRMDDEFWGISDYYDLEGIFDELNNRVSRISRVLDKHESPKLILPPGIMKMDEQTGRYYIEKEDLEAMELSDEDRSDLPKYLTWDAQLETSMKQIEQLLQLAFMMSETSPDAFGLSKDGGTAESGRALKFRLIRLLAKINRKKLYFNQALKNVLYAAQYLEAQWGKGPAPVDIRAEWQDGLPADELEQAQVEQTRTGSKATTSVRSAVRRLDGLEGEALEEELEEIANDEAAGQLAAPGGQGGRSGLNLGLGDDDGGGAGGGAGGAGDE